jgi:hypothetical protein
VEKAVRALPEEAAEEVRQETVRILKAFGNPKDNLLVADMRAVRTLWTNADLTILPAVKGKAAVVLNTSDYNRKTAARLGAPTYRMLPKDPTDAVERRTTLLLKTPSLPMEVTELRPQSSGPLDCTGSRRYTRKVPRMRLIVSTIGTPTFCLAQYLAKRLGEYVGKSPRHMKNSMEFINTKSLRAGPEDILVSFDVVSLFTMVPIVEALRLLSRNFDEDILRLFRHMLTSSFSRFNGQFYEQTDGVAMG